MKQNCEVKENQINTGIKPHQADFDLTQYELTKALYTSSIFSKYDLNPTTKLFLWALCTHFNPNKEDMFPSQTNVAKKLGISTKSAERAVKELTENGLIAYTTKRVNHYVFSEKFFEMVKKSVTVRQIVGNKIRQNVGLTNKHEQEKNKNFNLNTNLQIKSTMQNGGKALPTVEETEKYIEEFNSARKNCKNPLEYSCDEAFRWLSTTPKWLIQRSKVAKVLIKKYGFDEFELGV